MSVLFEKHSGYFEVEMAIYFENNVAINIPFQSTFSLSLIRTQCGFYQN